MIQSAYNPPVPLEPDDTVCFCFHVTLRKVESFCRQSKPQVASQISECLSAGTGCGWCIPMLKKVHKEICGDKLPWWREAEPDMLADVNPEKWSAGRQQYIAEGKGKPPEENAE